MRVFRSCAGFVVGVVSVGDEGMNGNGVEWMGVMFS
jgi:hypothetical protein